MEFGIDLDTTPRMTKRIKQYKPKQNLSKAEVQSLSAILKVRLDDLEYSIGMNRGVAKDLKQVDSDSDLVSHYFKRADKARVERNKLAKIQHKLKRGLSE